MCIRDRFGGAGGAVIGAGVAGKGRRKKGAKYGAIGSMVSFPLSPFGAVGGGLLARSKRGYRTGSPVRDKPKRRRRK